MSKMPFGHGPGRDYTPPSCVPTGKAHLSLRQMQSNQGLHPADGRGSRVRQADQPDNGATGSDRRRDSRETLNAPGTIYHKDGNFLVPCTVRDISRSGGRLELFKETLLPQYFLLSVMPDGSARRLCSKVWQLALIAGLRFVERQGS